MTMGSVVNRLPQFRALGRDQPGPSGNKGELHTMGDNKTSLGATHLGYRGKHRDSATRMGDRASFAVPAMSLGIACVGLTAAAPAAFAGGLAEPETSPANTEQSVNQQVTRPATIAAHESVDVSTLSNQAIEQQPAAQGIHVQQKQLPSVTPQSIAALPQVTAPFNAGGGSAQPQPEIPQDQQVAPPVADGNNGGTDASKIDQVPGQPAQPEGGDSCGKTGQGAGNETSISVSGSLKIGQGIEVSIGSGDNCSCPSTSGASGLNIAASYRHTWKGNGGILREASIGIGGSGSLGLVWGVNAKLSIGGDSHSTDTPAPAEKGFPISGGGDCGIGGGSTSGGGDCGVGGGDCGTGGSDCGTGFGDSVFGGGDCGTGGSDCGTGGSDCGTGFGDSIYGGSDCGFDSLGTSSSCGDDAIAPYLYA